MRNRRDVLVLYPNLVTVTELNWLNGENLFRYVNANKMYLSLLIKKIKSVNSFGREYAHFTYSPKSLSPAYFSNMVHNASPSETQYSEATILRTSRTRIAFQEGGLLSGVDLGINIFMFKFILTGGFYRGVDL